LQRHAESRGRIGWHLESGADDSAAHAAASQTISAITIAFARILFRPNPSSGVPIYLQLMEQVKHSIETGALRPGEQLPGIRPLAEELVINPNTVAQAYRELEHEGIIELRHGAGAFVSANSGAKNLSA